MTKLRQARAEVMVVTRNARRAVKGWVVDRLPEVLAVAAGVVFDVTTWMVSPVLGGYAVAATLTAAAAVVLWSRRV